MVGFRPEWRVHEERSQTGPKGPKPQAEEKDMTHKVDNGQVGCVSGHVLPQTGRASESQIHLPRTNQTNWHTPNKGMVSKTFSSKQPI